MWARAQAWIDAHPDQWAADFYVGQQGLKSDDARYAVRANGLHDIPSDWSQAIDRQQSAIDLMARETGRKPFDSATLFDRRFEPVAAEAFNTARGVGRLALAAEGRRTP